jgi:hypothetical protein
MARIQSYKQLVSEVNKNSGQFLNLSELAVYRRLPLLRIRELHSLAEKDPRTDPWAGTNFTQPEKFDEWYWGRRIELEIGGEQSVSTKTSGRNSSLNSTKRHRNRHAIPK